MSRLLSAASEEFEQHGYSGATTAAIARRADTTETQLFRYFDSKALLAREAIFKTIGEHSNRFHSTLSGSTGKKNLRKEAYRYIVELQNFISEHAQILNSLVIAQTYLPGKPRNAGEIDHLRAYFDFGASIMASRVKEPKVDPQLMVRVSFGAVLASVLFRHWLFPSDVANDADFTKAIVNFVLDGINANADKALSNIERAIRPSKGHAARKATKAQRPSRPRRSVNLS